MTDRMELLTGTKSKDGEKTYWTRIGMAFRSKDGEKWNLKFNALPINGEVLMCPPKPKDNNRTESSYSSPPSNQAPAPSMDDYGNNDPWSS